MFYAHVKSQDSNVAVCKDGTTMTALAVRKNGLKKGAHFSSFSIYCIVRSRANYVFYGELGYGALWSSNGSCVQNVASTTYYSFFPSSYTFYFSPLES